MRMFLTLAGLLPLLLTPTAPSIPEVHAALLTGTQVNFPADLQGKTTILVIGFSQGSRDQVASWGKRLAPDYHGVRDVAYYEVAEIEAAPRILRGYILKKIKEGVPEPAYPHFLAVTDHEVDWKAATHFEAKDDAYLVVVDPAGQITYTTHGPTSDAAYTTLKQRIETLRSH